MTAKLGGRPPMYSKPEDLEKAIQNYIDNPPKEKLITATGEEFEIPSFTITGLCWELGFESRQSFYDYELKDGFTYIIKRARLFIENAYEMRLKAPNCTGAIFALKNMGWKDKSELDVTQVETKSFADMYNE